MLARFSAEASAEPSGAAEAALDGQVANREKILEPGSSLESRTECELAMARVNETSKQRTDDLSAPYCKTCAAEWQAMVCKPATDPSAHMGILGNTVVIR